MEEVSLNMLLEPENTTISRIRERRRERILRNSDQRIRSILGGLDGAELRNAPALEGGEGFRNLVSPSETPISHLSKLAHVMEMSLCVGHSSGNLQIPLMWLKACCCWS
ncbi:hypothetical protein WUBG_14218 [Wuchereria bancrofti]|uniref:Uncharacterized protein n=1 Tax=Wuchereria bancrofti TaxID=6293 RepID=J9AKU9_WUCBA|nr:hypothetical protein WUBG_14218 [Wuchereria bancrofti]